MARIMATLKACDDICPLGQPVHDLAFAFIAPLGADNYNVGHKGSPICQIFKPCFL
jgi:hypothetical protein